MDKAKTSRPAWFDVVREQVSSLKFGHVQIIVHNSEVVQVERTERIRFNPSQESETKSPE